MTGFRFDVAAIRNRLRRAKASVEAISFRDDIAKFAERTLQTAVKITPVRSLSLIETNQAKQFAKRAEFIRDNPGSATRFVAQDQFIRERAQARFLYRLSWKQCADSARLRVTVSNAVARSVTRRRNPVEQPPKGYAQWRGGKSRMSLVIFNPLLDQESRYKPFTARDILAKAEKPYRAQFKRDTENRIRRVLYAASK